MKCLNDTISSGNHPASTGIKNPLCRNVFNEKTEEDISILQINSKYIRLMPNESLVISISSLNAQTPSLETPLAETCPACHETIEFESPFKGMCLQGHEWERCSMTLKIIDTVKYKDCLGCGKKVLSGDEGLSGGIREGVRDCMYCGNHFYVDGGYE